MSGPNVLRLVKDGIDLTLDANGENLKASWRFYTDTAMSPSESAAIAEGKELLPGKVKALRGVLERLLAGELSDAATYELCWYSSIDLKMYYRYYGPNALTGVDETTVMAFWLESADPDKTIDNLYVTRSEAVKLLGLLRTLEQPRPQPAPGKHRPVFGL